MVTRDDTQLATLHITSGSNKNHIPSLALVRYLLAFTQINSYLTRCSWENLLFATTSGNVSVISCDVSLVALLLLDLLIFQ